MIYTGVTLDRVAGKRSDARWVYEARERSDARFLPLWRNRNLIRPADASGVPEATALHRDQADWLIDSASELVLLGTDEGAPVFAGDLTACDEEQIENLRQHGEFVDLRKIGSLMNHEQSATLAYARGLLYWHRHNVCCARCGGPTESRDGGYSRSCLDSDCAQRTFPRLDPAVIMLIEYRPSDGGEPLCLLGRHSRLPAGMYSTLAGFVEPGESLEEAVIREVEEEVGIAVTEVRYQGSQPWPFPSSIMLGFRAQAWSTEVVLGDDELEEAHWFSAEEVKSFGEWGDATSERSIPRRDSIARYLISSWVDEVASSE